MPKPEYPIRVFFEDDGETWDFDNEKELASTLEWFDSEAPDEHAGVVDKLGRPVKLKVKELRVLLFELK